MELEIAKDLLDIGRIATQQLRSTFVPVDLAAVVRGAVTLVAPRAQGAGVEVRSAIEDVGLVAGEPTRLAQLLLALLGVAVGVVDPGGHVAVETDGVDDRIVVRVAWSGRRLLAHQSDWTLDQLGDDPATVLGPHRVGMSMFVARQLATLHGGRVVVEPQGRSGHPTVAVAFPRPRGM